MSEDKKTEVQDPDLENLLNSALQDFDKHLKINETKPETETKAESAVDTSDDKLNDVEWTTEFMKQASEQFEKKFQDILKNAGEYGESADPDLQAALAQTVQNLTTSTDDLQNDFASLLSQAGLDEGAGDMMSFMDKIMQIVLSKDILYTSFKDFSDKYPEWLEEKRDTLSSDDIEKYENQMKIIRQACTLFESEKDDDTEEVKSQRFKKIFSLMQELQNYGSMPEELIGEYVPNIQFGNDGNPIMPTLPPGTDVPPDCCIM